MALTRLDGLRVVLGDDACHMCDRDGFEGMNVEFRHADCPKCKGTGRRGNGRCRNCNPQYNYSKVPPGKVRDLDQPYAAGPCRWCDGTRFTPANMSSYIPPDMMDEVIDRIGVRVYTRAGELSWAESHLGMVMTTDAGTLLSLWSCTDYGRTWDRLAAAAQRDQQTTMDDALEAGVTHLAAEIEEFRQEIIGQIRRHHVAVCKVFSGDGVIGQEIVVSLARNGYSVITRERTAEQRAEILAAITV